MKKLWIGSMLLLVIGFVLMAANTPGVQDGNTAVKPLSQDQASRLIAAWGTWVPSSAADTADITVATYWRFKCALSATLVPKCNGIINNSGSTIAMKLITSDGDTLPAFHIPAYGYSGLMPDIRFIFNTGSSDSVIYCIRW
jgi:hypothetical protein